MAPGEITPFHYHGTGFSVGIDGYFLSAHHVVNQDCLTTCAPGHYIAALVIQGDGENRTYKAARILKTEQYQNTDIVIGRLDCGMLPFFTSRNSDAYGWEDVHVFGYPESRKKAPAADLFQFGPQFLKGYITRRLEAKDLMNPAWDPAYELSFPIPLGVSGSPVFRRGPDHALVGIALGSTDSTVSVYEHTEICGPSGKYSEQVKKVEQFGIAARLSALADWRPVLAGGKRLYQIY
jgi:hypothetical protein